MKFEVNRLDFNENTTSVFSMYTNFWKNRVPWPSLINDWNLFLFQSTDSTANAQTKTSPAIYKFLALSSVNEHSPKNGKKPQRWTRISFRRAKNSDNSITFTRFIWFLLTADWQHCNCVVQSSTLAVFHWISDGLCQIRIRTEWGKSKTYMTVLDAWQRRHNLSVIIPIANHCVCC